MSEDLTLISRLEKALVLLETLDLKSPKSDQIRIVSLTISLLALLSNKGNLHIPKIIIRKLITIIIDLLSINNLKIEFKEFLQCGLIALKEFKEYKTISRTTYLHLIIASSALSKVKPSSDLLKNDNLYPRIVHIETQALCNAKCSFCDYTSLSRKGIIMSDDKVDKILTDLSEIPHDHQFIIQPYKISEPFLEPRLPELIYKYLTFHPSTTISIISNGNFLPKDNFKKILSYFNSDLGTLTIENKTLSRIRFAFSLNEIDKSKYQKLMRLNFNHTIDNLNYIHEYIKLNKLNVPIDISRVSTHPIGDYDFKNYIIKNFPLFNPRILKMNDWMSTNNFSNNHELFSTLPIEAFKNLSCSRWSDLSIMANGDLALCCMDSGTAKLNLGNIYESNCLDLYRKKFARYIPNDLTRGSSPYPCNVCTYRQGNDLENSLYKLSRICEKS